MTGTVRKTTALRDHVTVSVAGDVLESVSRRISLQRCSGILGEGSPIQFSPPSTQPRSKGGWKPIEQEICSRWDRSGLSVGQQSQTAVTQLCRGPVRLNEQPVDNSSGPPVPICARQPGTFHSMENPELLDSFLAMEFLDAIKRDSVLPLQENQPCEGPVPKKKYRLKGETQ